MKRNIDAFRDETFDLLIIGGGITGAGVALDAVLNNWRVALIDRGDFASGTSSASSKLIHGGIRYLEHGDFRLVHEALHERRLLLKNAPNLVRPLRFVIPFYQGARVPAWKWRAGLALYDLLAGSSNIRRSRPLGPAHLRREFPGLRQDHLIGGAEYFDAQMDDARLCIDVMQTAARQGAVVANYIEALAFETRGGEIVGARALDHQGGGEFTIKARQVLNAAGPGVDAVCRLANDASGPHLQPTKGAHLIAPPLHHSAAFLLLHPRDGRVFFVIPWMGKTLIGTTDTHWTNDSDPRAVSSQEIDYLLEGFNRYFQPLLQPDDILGSFSGLRPLMRAKPGDPSSLSREFKVFASPSGLLSVAGGKYTTYRAMAEVITRTIAKPLKRRYRNTTRRYPLDGAPEGPVLEFERKEAESLAGRNGLGLETAHHLVSRYGRRARDIVSIISQHADLVSPIVPGELDIRAELLYHLRQEMALFPEDFLLRRTRLGLFHPHLLREPFPELGAARK